MLGSSLAHQHEEKAIEETGIERTEQVEEGIMIPMLHDMRAVFFLMVALAILLFICAWAPLGAVLQPVRWSDRTVYR